MKKYFKILSTAICISCFSFYVHAQTITTVAGNGTVGLTGDGSAATACELHSPSYVAFDNAGNMYIADEGNNVIRKVAATGAITLFAGSYIAGNGGDHGPATSARLNSPTAVAVDGAGNVYICDCLNNVIRKVNTSGVITTIAGNYTSGYGGDSGLATNAMLSGPVSITLDASGNLYIADYWNNVIRKVNTHDSISTFAGNDTSGYSGDNGPALVAKMSNPSDLVADGAGNIYIADYGNNVIRKVNSHDTISTFAGNGSLAGGDGGPATAAGLNAPDGVGIDSAGNIYIADMGNEKIRIVDIHGIINTYAGNGTTGFSGDNGPAIAAEISSPSGVCGRGAGVIYISDFNNERIRKVTPMTTAIDNQIQPRAAGGIRIYPNPANEKVYITSSENIESVTATDLMGRVIYQSHPQRKTISLKIEIPGIYFISAVTTNEKLTTEIEVK